MGQWAALGGEAGGGCADETSGGGAGSSHLAVSLQGQGTQLGSGKLPVYRSVTGVGGVSVGGSGQVLGPVACG